MIRLKDSLSPNAPYKEILTLLIPLIEQHPEKFLSQILDTLRIPG
jgi:hypothetical protein